MASDRSSFATTGEPGFNEKMLFWASFFTLIAAGIGFSVRGEILGDWGQQFRFTQSELGTITGGGLVGFGVTIIVLSFVADAIGYGKLMTLAFLLHASSAAVTLAATPVYAAYGKDGAFYCLNIGMWLFALGNGTCEAVINPLTATLFPRNKTHWLNILHAGWPGGLILGALIALLFNQLPGWLHLQGPIRWEYKYGVFAIPVLLYGLMMLGRKFPRSEASRSGIGIGTMILTLLSPILLFLYLMHAMVGYVELGTDSWIINIGNTVLNNKDYALMTFIWTNLVMFGLRFFAGPIVHKISPLGLLFVSSLLGTAGLALFSTDYVNSFGTWLAVSTVYAVGKTFYWPTLLGVISERFPKGGAIALGLSGGIGMIAAGLLGGPGIGYKQDYFAVQQINALSKDSYDRYVSRDDQGNPSKSGFPILTKLMPEELPPVAGLDNGKLKVFDDYGNVVAGQAKSTTLESDLETLQKVKAEGGKIEPKLETELTGLMKWWDELGKPNYTVDKEPLTLSRLFGAKQALLYTAAVPAGLAVGFLLLIIVFAAMGGYKQIHLEGGSQGH